MYSTLGFDRVHSARGKHNYCLLVYYGIFEVMITNTKINAEMDRQNGNVCVRACDVDK